MELGSPSAPADSRGGLALSRSGKRRAWDTQRLAVVIGLGIAALLLAYWVSNKSRANGAGASTATGHGRVTYTLPLELRIRGTNAFFVGGELTSFWLEVPNPAPRLAVLLRAGGQSCASEPNVLPLVDVRVDDQLVHTFAIDAPPSERRAYTSKPIVVAPGVRRFVLVFSNDYYGGPDCDRNAWVDQLVVTAEASSAALAGTPVSR